MEYCRSKKTRYENMRIYKGFRLRKLMRDMNEWKRMKNRMPMLHKWECIFAKTEKRKGRAKGGFILGKKKDWGEKGSKIGQIKEEGIVVSRIKRGRSNRDVIIISMYNSRNWKAIENTIKEMLENN